MTFRRFLFCYLCGMNLNRQILSLALPAIVSNVTVPLLGLSDTAISGHLGSAVFIAAISVGSLMMSQMTGVLVFLRMGTTGLTAVAYGKKDEKGIGEIFSCSLMIAFLLGILLVLFQKPMLVLLMHIIGPDAEVRSLASDYFRICVSGTPALLGTMAISGWFIGMQSTFWPMIISVTVNIINILTSFLLVFTFGIGFKGVAYGTLVANCIGLVLAFVFALRMAPAGTLWCGWNALFRFELLRRFFSVNSNIFLRSLCVMSVTIAVSAFGARLGSLTLATNAVIVQFFIFFSYFRDGFAFTGEALCGRNFGAGDRNGLNTTVRYLLWWSAGIALVFTLLYSSGWQWVTCLLTDDMVVRESVSQNHIWIQLIPLFTVLAFIYDGFFIGITFTRPMLIATSVAVGVFFIVTLPYLDGNGGVSSAFSNNIIWGAFLGYLFVRGVILAVIWHGRVIRINSL